MKGIIRKGDTTTSGGEVLAGSESMVFDGLGAARLGDLVMCPVPGHGLNAIAEGNSTYKDNGVPVAFDGDLCECGCALISSLSAATAR